MNNVAIFQNEFEWHVRGSIDLSAAAAVTAIRGTNMTATKTGTGAYSVVIKGNSALKLYEVISSHAEYSGANAPATALGVRVVSVTQAATDDITIVLNTTALPTSGAATDGTAAVTVNFEVIIRFGRNTSPF